MNKPIWTRVDNLYQILNSLEYRSICYYKILKWKGIEGVYLNLSQHISVHDEAC